MCDSSLSLPEGISQWIWAQVLEYGDLLRAIYDDAILDMFWDIWPRARPLRLVQLRARMRERGGFRSGIAYVLSTRWGKRRKYDIEPTMPCNVLDWDELCILWAVERVRCAPEILQWHESSQWHLCLSRVSSKSIMKSHKRTFRRIEDLRNGTIGFVLRDWNYVWPFRPFWKKQWCLSFSTAAGWHGYTLTKE